MVDHELSTRRKFSFPEVASLSQKQIDMVRMFNRDEKIREITEMLQKSIRSMNSGEYSSKHEKFNWNSEELTRTLSNLGSELLSRSPTDIFLIPMTNELKELENAYKQVMEMFLFKMENFLESIKELREEMRKSIQNFHNFSRFTAKATLASSATTLAVQTSNVLQRVFHFNLSPKIFIVSGVVGCASITASALSLSYMKQSIGEISRELKDESRSFRDLVVVHRRGNWIDEEILRLFPHGINLKFLDEEVVESLFEDKMTWRLYLCYVIILTNIQKEPALLKDERFLASVKIFVESHAAEIWWHRIKIKNLMHTMLKKMDDTSVKEFIAVHRVLYNRTALCLYPMLFHLMATSWNSVGIFCSSVAALIAYSTLKGDETEESKKLKNVSNKFERDFTQIKEICRTMDNDYD